MGPLETVEGLLYIRALREFQEAYSKQGPRLVTTPVDSTRREALDAAATYLAVASDHLISFEVLVRTALPTFAGYSVLRPALEGAERARWVLPPDPAAGLGRLLADRWAALDEQRKDLNAMREVLSSLSTSQADAFEARVAQVEDEFTQLLERAADNDVPVWERGNKGPDGQRARAAERRGVDVLSISRRRVVMIGERYPSSAMLMRRVLSASPTHGPLIYRRMSSSIHARWAGTNPVADDTVDRGGPGDSVAASLTVNTDELDLAYEVTAGSVVHAAGAIADLAGYCRHEFQVAHRNAIRERKGKQPLWPPPQQIMVASVIEGHSPCPCCSAPRYLFENDQGWIRWCRTCPPNDDHSLHAYERVTGHGIRQVIKDQT